MQTLTGKLCLPMLSLLALTIAGCPDAEVPEKGNVETGAPPETVHAHPSHGPHDGDLIELGNEAFHAEIVHGDGSEISIYILGSDAKTSVPIDATEITINATHEGTPEQFKLKATPVESDPEGKSSRFVADDAELSEHLHEEEATAKLVLDIEGKQYTGKIAHEHDHDHGHAHD